MKFRDTANLHPMTVPSADAARGRLGLCRDGYVVVHNSRELPRPAPGVNVWPDPDHEEPDRISQPNQRI